VINAAEPNRGWCRPVSELQRGQTGLAWSSFSDETAREQRLAESLVELADTLVADFDLVDVLHTLTLRCVDLLDAAEVGLMLADPTGELRVMASSSERAHLLELFEIQNAEGPCLDCYRTG
jgi:hypothetical protein